jgi:hypothetical protein
MSNVAGVVADQKSTINEQGLKLTPNKTDLNIISSMGGTGSTSFIHWFSKRLDTNCYLNSEGLPKRGAGSNAKGLKHRITPPEPDDQYIPKGKAIKNIVFIADSPYNTIPSLFRRNIAGGHAVAITGSRPPHKNDLDTFLSIGEDSFGFREQFFNWVDPNIKRPYRRLIIKFEYLWEYLEEVFNFIGIPQSELSKFPPNKISQRKSSFDNLTENYKERFRHIYKDLHQVINEYPPLSII